jgi:hypothetical protein
LACSSCAARSCACGECASAAINFIKISTRLGYVQIGSNRACRGPLPSIGHRRSSSSSSCRTIGSDRRLATADAASVIGCRRPHRQQPQPSPQLPRSGTNCPLGHRNVSSMSSRAPPRLRFVSTLPSATRRRRRPPNHLPATERTWRRTKRPPVQVLDPPAAKCYILRSTAAILTSE